MTTDIIYLWGREEQNEKKGGLRIFKIITVTTHKGSQNQNQFWCMHFHYRLYCFPFFLPPSLLPFHFSFLPSLVEPMLFIYTFCILVCQLSTEKKLGQCKKI